MIIHAIYYFSENVLIIKKINNSIGNQITNLAPPPSSPHKILIQNPKQISYHFVFIDYGFTSCVWICLKVFWVFLNTASLLNIPPDNLS